MAKTATRRAIPLRQLRYRLPASLLHAILSPRAAAQDAHEFSVLFASAGGVLFRSIGEWAGEVGYRGGDEVVGGLGFRSVGICTRSPVGNREGLLESYIIRR